MRIFRWQILTLALLFVGYSGYYLCRSVLPVATPLLLCDFSGSLTKTDIGWIASFGVFFYAIGKTINGLLVDRLGGRLLFVLGMVISAGCAVLFGLASSLPAFAAIWSVNRYVQSVGWGAMVYLAARWFPHSVRATVMGVLSMSFLVGDAAARSYLGRLLASGVEWRGLFFYSAATLGAIALVTLLLLKSSPRAVGGEEPEEKADTVYGPGGEAQVPGFLALLLPLLRSGPFWLICGMCAGLTFIRETFNFWTPTYLVEAVGLSPEHAAYGSMAFSLTGGVAALVGGLLADLLHGKYSRILVPSLLPLAGFLALLALLPVRDRPWLALTLVAGSSFFLLVPYCFLAGVAALDLGGKHGGSTAAGLIDTAGYLGATLSGSLVGTVAHTHGWPAVFSLMTLVVLPTAVLGAVHWYQQERRARRTQTSASQGTG